MSNLESARRAFVEAILETEEYQNYARMLEKVKQFSDLKAQIDDFRMRNYILQSSADTDLDKIDKFEKEYETFREDPLVSDFLAAELGLCRMIQGLNTLITADIHFE